MTVAQEDHAKLIVRALELDQHIFCPQCGNQVTECHQGTREWAGHSYSVPIFDCGCCKDFSFGNYITEMVEAAAVLPLMYKELARRFKV